MSHNFNDKERIRVEHEASQAEKFAKLDEIIDLMNKNSSDMGITLFMPHVAKDAYRKTLETAKWLSLVNRAGKMIQITPDMMETLNYNLENPIDARILDEIFYKDIFAVLWYMDPRTAVTDALREFVRRVSQPQEYEIEGEESVWETILDSLIVDPNKVEESVRGSLQSTKIEDAELIAEKSEAILPTASVEPSVATIVKKESLSRVSQKVSSIKEPSVRYSMRSKSKSQLIIDTELESEVSSVKTDDGLITIPPVWTPTNQTGNAIFMHQFFRNVSMKFLLGSFEYYVTF